MLGIDTVAEVGALSFGTIIGWYVYYINRYRKRDVGIGDITSMLGAIGGAAVTGIFAKGDEFGAYGTGLGIGFFSYFLVLMLLVAKSENFDSDWFLDGRRRDPAAGVTIPGDARPTFGSMSMNSTGFYLRSNPPAPSPFVVQPIVLAPANLEVMSLPPAQYQRRSLGTETYTTALNPNAQKVLDFCISRWETNKKDCNAFVKAVATDCGVTLDGNADAIVGTITETGWRMEADGVAAFAAAQEGRLVVGGLTAADLGDNNGHVVEVVGNGLEHAKYPSAYWGTLAYDSLPDDKKKNGGSGKGVNWSFDNAHRDLVKYGSIAI